MRYYGIYNEVRRAWVVAIDPVSGRCSYSRCIYDARGWADRARAEELAAGVGSVRVLP